jgi:6-phosphogluconolactonase (cycloisomerase 2 family)
MLNRRTFSALTASALAAPHSVWSETMSKSFFYASLGPALTLYRVDVDGASVARQGTVMLPAKIQYAWPHPTAPLLYVATSNGGASSLGVKGDKHDLNVLSIDPQSGALKPHGAPAVLKSRPIHVTVDHTGRFALVAYNDPSNVTVHRINSDGTVGEEVKQAATLDCGIFTHQIRVSPNNEMAILVCRGNDAAKGKPEDPGALKVFSFKDGQLANTMSVAPNGGYGFGPRHIDFHPTLPLIYVSRERENKLDVYRFTSGAVEGAPVFVRETLADPAHIRSRQQACTLHVHPNGRFLYLANRAFDTVKVDGKDIFPGGENNIAAFAIDAASGEPTLIQNEDVRGVYPRTFALDPSARMLVVTNNEPKLVRDGADLKTIPANIATFRIGGDGKLAFASSIEIETDGDTQFWSGMVTLG